MVFSGWIITRSPHPKPYTCTYSRIATRSLDYSSHKDCREKALTCPEMPRGRMIPPPEILDPKP